MKAFEFIVQGPPVSLNAKKNNARRYQKWIKTVRSAAVVEWPVGRSATEDKDVEVSITNYYTLAPPDVDNIIKPILDSLETVVYLNDKQVRRVTSERFNLHEISKIINPSPLLATALENYSELLHIVVHIPED